MTFAKNKIASRDAMGVGAYRGVRKAGVDGQWKLGRAERRHRWGRGCIHQRSTLQVWSLAVVSKCTFILPLVDSILKRGEDERDVKNGMISFTNFESFFSVGVGVGLAAWAFAFACHVHAQSKHFQGT